VRAAGVRDMRRAHGLSAAPQALLCSAPGAPEAPVWRPGPQDGVVPLDACHPRHMGPHSAAGGAVSGLQPTPAAPVRDCGREGRQIALVRPTTGHRSRNPTGPEMMTAHERLAEVASLLARGFLRARLRAAEKRQNGLAILRTSSHECPKWLGGPCPPPWRPKAKPPESEGESL